MPNFEIEGSIDGLICGIDEVGRGPLAGPVVAACVHIPKNIQDKDFICQINDSKKLTKKRRETLSSLIRMNCNWGIGLANVDEIDDLNILNATFLAMSRAYSEMKLDCSKSLIDGNRIPKDFPIAAQCIIKGDTVSTSIAAASIIAKVFRDNLMLQLHQEYPSYGWDKNSGYGTAHHLKSLNENGPCNHHRHSFAPVRKAASK